MEKRNIICIGCPLGCMIEVIINQGEIQEVKGNSCKRGEIYARKECVCPTRIVTSTVMVEGGVIPMVSVKTSGDIHKEKIEACMRALKGVKVSAPVHIGDVIETNVAETGVDIVATKAVPKI